MSTTEQRFEVPPEYADVYERAYRRAYDEGQNQLVVLPSEGAPRRVNARGKRVALPRQRTAGRRESDARPGGSHAVVASAPAPLDQAGSSDRARPVAVRERSSHRADPRRGSTVLPLLGLAALLGLLLAGAFLLGRVTADAVSVGATPATGAGPGAAASAVEGPKGDAVRGRVSAATPYTGPQVPLAVTSARSTCTQAPTVTGASATASYAVTNVLDPDPASAWGCAGTAVGDELVFDLPAGSQVVSVGLVPGFASTDPTTGVDLYAQDNRITEVVWIFGDGGQVVQSISDDPLNRSLRAVSLAPKASDTVTLKILGVAPGQVDATLISTVAIAGPA